MGTFGEKKERKIMTKVCVSLPEINIANYLRLTIEFHIPKNTMSKLQTKFILSAIHITKKKINK